MAAADDDAKAPASHADDAADMAALERQRSIEQAIAEGHDADIPSDIGYVLDEKGQSRRRQSIASRRRASLARKPSTIEEPSGGRSRREDVDVERTAGSASSQTQVEEGAASSGDDDQANIVWWDGDDDRENPYNWPTWKKNVNIGLISLLTFLTPLASSIFAPGVPQLMREFHSSDPELSGFVVSIYVLGFAFGPLLIAPLSEIYGRMPVYHVCNVGFVAFVIGSALAPSLGSLIAFRFLSGVFGSCPITNGGGSIADLIVTEKRARYMAIFSIGPLLGPIIGPVAGGFLADAAGWRWNFWLLVIVGGVVSIGMLIFLRETYAPVVMERKAARLRKETGNELLRSKLDIGLSPRDYFKRGIVRPLKMLTLSPITMVFSLYMAVVYGYLYLLFTSITPVFEQYYGFSTSTVGLVFLGLGIGSMLGLAYFSMTSDPYVRKKMALHGQMKPEWRLKALPVGAALLPAGFFIYGWSAQYHVHWIVPILGTVVIGTGNLVIFMAVQLYLVDAFSMYAASALAANTVIRSIAGACLPLAALRMYDSLGLGWGNSLLGFIALAMVPIPFVIIRYGEHLRTRFQVDL